MRDWNTSPFYYEVSWSLLYAGGYSIYYLDLLSFPGSCMGYILLHFHAIPAFLPLPLVAFNDRALLWSICHARDERRVEMDLVRNKPSAIFTTDRPERRAYSSRQWSSSRAFSTSLRSSESSDLVAASARALFRLLQLLSVSTCTHSVSELTAQISKRSVIRLLYPHMFCIVERIQTLGTMSCNSCCLHLRV